MASHPLTHRERLDRRRLNRATLARQLLLERSDRTVLDVVGHLVGMQAQVPTDPYVGLWSRIAGFEPSELSLLLLDRAVVRMGLMRGTLHLVTAADALALRAHTQPVLERSWKSSPFARQLAGVDLAALRTAGRAFLDVRPATTAAIGKHLGSVWPGRDQASLAYAVRYFEPVVQVPPRGTWGGHHQATWATVETWLGRQVPSESDDAAIALRYLAAFGPASVQDMQAWCWRTKLAPVFEQIRPNLVAFRDEHGVELFDLPDAPRPPADSPAPVRFLPEFDNVLLSHKDRSRFLVRPLAFERSRGSVLVDGVLQGTWRVKNEPDGPALDVWLFDGATPDDEHEVAAEAGRLLTFLSDGRGGAVRLAAAGERRPELATVATR